jgi:hypothetical protein
LYSARSRSSSGAIFTDCVKTTGDSNACICDGSNGFIGTELVKELIEAGHQVRGLTRSDAGVEQLKAVGAEVHRGDLRDLDNLRSGAKGMDAVVNLAFSHDWSKFAQNAEEEIKAIEVLGSGLEPGKLLVVTSGVGLTSGAPDHVRTESDPPVDLPAILRRPEPAADADGTREGRLGVCGRRCEPLGCGSAEGCGASVSSGGREDGAERVTYPLDIASHSRKQGFYFGPDYLLRRHDYHVEAAGGFAAAQYVYDSVTVQGITLPTKRRAYMRDERLVPLHDRLMVSIDVADISFS